MTKIVAGFGTSHGPQLKASPPQSWELRGVADRRNQKLEFRGKRYTYDELKAEREDFSHEITHEVMQRRWRAAQASMDKLSAFIKQSDVDALVIVSSDHKEVYGDELLPVFAVYWGDSVDHVPFTAEQLKGMAPGLAEAASGDVPSRLITRPTHRSLARHLIEQSVENGFDTAASETLPAGSYDNHSIPHGHGFIYQRFMGEDSTVPFVPVFINTFYEPNPPTARRCFEFGQALGRAIESYPGDMRIGVVASGGLSHFVVDEKLDRDFLTALETNDVGYLTSVPSSEMRSGASELRNWIAVAGIANVAGLSVASIDYEPCYRTEAGTGNAMGFVTWNRAEQ